ncbi:MAG: sigma-70 family RNA polymerase sigma factor [Planctomycetota bacterium]|nr:sigma-70 family RNA polymerase sigma factor [Planctomycetota bacterium]
MLDSTSSESELFRASMRGNANAFEAIVQRYQSLVCAITFGATANLDKSEELAHEAFIRAWTNLAQLEDMAKFRAWLCTIARNVVRNYIRGKKRDVISHAVSLEKIRDISSGKSEPVEAVIDKEQQAVIRRALEQMPEAYREPLILFYREQKSLKQVAEQLELSEEAARTRVSRGRKLLRLQVAAMVEDVIGRTGPGKAFTAGVVASIAGMAIKGSSVATAVGVGAAASATGVTTVIKTIMSSVAAKIVAATAVAAIGVGTVLTYKQFNKTTAEREISEPVDIAKTQGREEEQRSEEAINESKEESPSLIGAENTEENLESEKSAGLSRPVVFSGSNKFELVPTGVLSGVFTDANTLEPIKGVYVHIYCPDHGEQHRAQSNANGVYFFESVKRDGSYRITLETNEYITPEEWRRPRDDDVQLAPSTRFVKHYQLQKGCKVKIKTVDELGKPIKNVGFYAAYVSDDVGRGPKRSVRSDREGNAVIGGLKPTEYMLTALHNDYAFAGRKIVFDEAFEIQSVIFKMQVGSSIEGKAICSDGLAASGWTVSAEPV